MFKIQVESRAAGEWFHCKVLNILWRHFTVYKSVGHENCGRFFLYQNDEIFPVN